MTATSAASPPPRTLRENFVDNDENPENGTGININNDLRRVDRYMYVGVYVCAGACARVCMCVCVSVCYGIMQREKIAHARPTSNSHEPVVSVSAAGGR